MCIRLCSAAPAVRSCRRRGLGTTPRGAGAAHSARCTSRRARRQRPPPARSTAPAASNFPQELAARPPARRTSTSRARTFSWPRTRSRRTRPRSRPAPLLAPLRQPQSALQQRRSARRRLQRVRVRRQRPRHPSSCRHHGRRTRTPRPGELRPSEPSLAVAVQELFARCTLASFFAPHASRGTPHTPPRPPSPTRFRATAAS